MIPGASTLAEMSASLDTLDRYETAQLVAAARRLLALRELVRAARAARVTYNEAPCGSDAEAAAYWPMCRTEDAAHDALDALADEEVTP